MPCLVVSQVWACHREDLGHVGSAPSRDTRTHRPPRACQAALENLGWEEVNVNATWRERGTVSSVCRAPGARRLLPAPHQAGVRQCAGQTRWHCKAPAGDAPWKPAAPMKSSSKQFIGAGLWLNVRSSLPLMVSSSSLNPRIPQISFWNYVLWTETAAGPVQCCFTKM